MTAAQKKEGGSVDPKADKDREWWILQSNGAWLLVRGLVKRPGRARPNRLSNSTLEFHQTTYQKPYAIDTPFEDSLCTTKKYPQSSCTGMATTNPVVPSS